MSVLDVIQGHVCYACSVPKLSYKCEAFNKLGATYAAFSQKKCTLNFMHNFNALVRFEKHISIVCYRSFIAPTNAFKLLHNKKCIH